MKIESMYEIIFWISYFYSYILWKSSLSLNTYIVVILSFKNGVADFGIDFEAYIYRN